MEADVYGAVEFDPMYNVHHLPELGRVEPWCVDRPFRLGYRGRRRDLIR